MLRRLLSPTQRVFLSSGRSAGATQYTASRSLCEEVAKENSLDRIGTTWRNQDSLPVLPIQPLADTCARYREYLRPLLTEEEFAEINEQITKFENTSLAADLQSQLLGLQEHEANWLEAFWDEMYLTIRDRLPINVNPFFALDGQWESTSNSNQPIAVLVKAMARFNKVLKTRLLVPDMEGETALCMYQYSKLFGGNRYPRKHCDVFSSNRYSQRVILMRRGQMFTMTVENDKQQLLPTSVLREQIDAICKMSNAMSVDEPPVGYFTCSDREEWAENYAALQAHSTRNEANLDAIAGALFVINVDEFEYEEMDVRAKALFHNRGENRWFDKLQLAISSDGYVGFNMEHTPIDGHTLVQLATDVHADLDGNAAYPNSILLAPAKTYDIPPPEHLKFDLDGPLRERLEKAKSEFESYADQTDSIPMMHGVGKRFIKKCNTSPDAFVQMAIQLAYYKEYGRFDSTYESALTKQFLHGRTETIRTVSETSKDYCSRFSTENLADSGILLMEACRKHAKIAKLAKNGFGVDRHLFGLNCLSKIEKEANPNFQIPGIFTSPHYAKYSSNLISTSNCGGDRIGLFGFGPVHPDGVGVGYLIKDNSTHLHVSTTNGQGVAFSQRLQEALNLQCRALRATNADVIHE